MNAKIRYFRFDNNQKVILPDPPEGFPTLIDTSQFAHLNEGVSIARSMGELMRSTHLTLPSGILFEQEH
jgi:hypothetical protein